MCFIGHSKGADLGLACSGEFPNKIGLTISNSCFIHSPVFTDSSYRSRIWKNTGGGPVKMAELGTHGSDGIYRLNWGLAEAIHYEGEYLYRLNKNNEFELNVDLLQKSQKDRPRYHLGRKIFHFMSIDDPILAPNRTVAREYANILFGMENVFVLRFLTNELFWKSQKKLIFHQHCLVILRNKTNVNLRISLNSSETYSKKK